ncbi:polynucleotide adenylyltransferase [Phytohalomonas tamaricis]|uniref:polynucleotide adenylyltransferase n=1 Tax=Phytohalomonas tamaricis TaxID=2081032 RepID=UPI000D0AF651|nr:polynucleotide adenylyltransferase [Phytohalomonas tamaricis]
MRQSFCDADPALDGLEVYRVGGAVRDERLGRPCFDQDWVVVGATPEQMLSRGFRPVGRDFPVFLHPETHEEYALARTERKQGHGYTGFTVHAEPSVTLEEDLERRDLTINAMAQACDGQLIDPFGGAHDCDARLLRHVSMAFVEDPLRVLRVARFLARFKPLGFTIANETQALMRLMVESGEIEHLVAERVWQETEKALGEPCPQAYFTVLKTCGALEVLLPELAESNRLATALTRMTQADQREQRWALLLAEMDSAVLETLCQRLRVPNAYRELAILLSRSWGLADEELDAERIVAWLGLVDAWRRPERFKLLLDTLAAGGQTNMAEQLESAYQRASEISPQQLMQQGFKGAELGKALTRHRCEAVAQILNT